MKKLKWNRKLSILVLIMFVTVSFASFNTNLFINGKAYVRVDEAIRIVDIKLLDTEYDGYETMDPEYNKNTITMDANLPKQASSVTYQVSIQNTYPYDYDITDIIEENFTNKDVSYEIVGANKNTILPKNTTTTFTIKFTNNKTITEEEDVYQTLTYDFDYTGEEQEFIVPFDGEYTLEVWGAQGGNTIQDYHGGYGGYAKGTVLLKKNQSLFIVVGGAGTSTMMQSEVYAEGGYNGGGRGRWNGDVALGYNASGGGATHIATSHGLLKRFENTKGSIMIVAGGGGGAVYWDSHSGNPQYGIGGSGGGIEGGVGLQSRTTHRVGNGGTQTAGGTQTDCGSGTFGQGGNSAEIRAGGAGGGGGFYGGSGSYDNAGAGGGSGYIGNSKLSNKVMYCYQCTESSETSTKTVSTDNHSETPTADYAKEGNGYAKITVTRKIVDGSEYLFDYTGGEQTFNAPYTGIYKLETWGAQGGSQTTIENLPGGYGAYSAGNIDLLKDSTLYINVGGQGISAGYLEYPLGGYNGGGRIPVTTINDKPSNRLTASGGGATHIAKVSGILSELENSKSDVLIVSGGGGGSYQHTNNSAHYGKGGSAGGFKGVNGQSSVTNQYYGLGGTQTEAGCAETSLTNCGGFGYGGDAGNGTHGSAGGAGWYGGGGCEGTSIISNGSGAGGSSYIGNELLYDKIMYCYNCEESQEKNTRTVKTLSHSKRAKQNIAKEGNGYSKITLLKRQVNNTKLTLKFEFARHLYDYTITYNENHLEPNLLKDYFQTSVITKCCGTFDNPLLETINILTDEKGLYYNSFNVAGDDGPNRGYYIRTRYNFPLEVGKKYKVTFEAIARETAKCTIGPEQNHDRMYNVTIQGGVWKKYSFSFVAVKETYSQFIIYDWMSKTFENELTVRNIEVSETQSEVTYTKVSTETQPIGDNIAPTPFRDGWEFLGWYDDPVEGNKITSDSLAPSEDTTYYAHWKQVNYNIDYDLDGGTITNQPTDYYYLSDEKAIPAPTKSGYTFTGWTGGKNLLDVTKLSSVAKNFDISVDENGYISDGSNNTDGRAWGYPRSNWFVSLDSGTYALTLYFDQQCTNTSSSAINIYDSNNNVLRSSSNISNKDKVTYTFTIKEAKDIGIFIKAYDGVYRIQLEKGSKRTSYEAYNTEPTKSLTIPYYSSGNRKYIANWTKNYSIEYDLDGGSINNQPTDYSTETESFTLPIPTKEGYTFVGWTGGKNIFSYDYIDSQQVSGQGGTTTTSGKRGLFDVKPNTYYSLSTNLPKREEDGGRYVLLSASDDINDEIYSGANGADATTSRTVISTENGHILISYFKQLMSSEMLTKLNNDEYWFQIEEGEVPTTHELNIETPTVDVTIPKGSNGNRKYTANWIKNE